MSETRSAPYESRWTRRILVADGDDDTRVMYREWFQKAGADVVDAADGREALAKALSLRPTVVITELRLPFLDGFALCDVLRRDSLTSAVPIIVVTGESRPAEVDRARGAGADLVLIKPVTPESLLQEVNRVLDRPAPAAESAVAGAERLADGRRLRAKREAVITTTPPVTPPDLLCPTCDRRLRYERSHLGGVGRRQAEQWDTYSCQACGTFEYRHRTRKLRSGT